MSTPHDRRPEPPSADKYRELPADERLALTAAIWASVVGGMVAYMSRAIEANDEDTAARWSNRAKLAMAKARETEAACEQASIAPAEVDPVEVMRIAEALGILDVLGVRHTPASFAGDDTTFYELFEVPPV